MKGRERWQAWNHAGHDLPRKGVVCLCVLGAFWLISMLVPVVLPFFLGWLLALILRPIARLLDKGLDRLIKPSGKMRWLSALLAMLLVLGPLCWGAVILINRLLSELTSLLQYITANLGTFGTTLTNTISSLYERSARLLPDDALLKAESLVAELTQELSALLGSGARLAASGALATAMSVPTLLLVTVLTVTSAYYLTSDRARIAAFLRRQVAPATAARAARLRHGVTRALWRQAGAQLQVSLIVTLALALGLLWMGIPYWLLLGLLIGLVDALPVLGSGLVLIPWALWGLLTGDTALGFGMLALYVAVAVVRQIAEPRIVGASLGLHPLATMTSMYAGYAVIGGFLGLLLGPLLLNIINAVLALLPPSEEKTPQPESARAWLPPVSASSPHAGAPPHRTSPSRRKPR